MEMGVYKVAGVYAGGVELALNEAAGTYAGDAEAALYATAGVYAGGVRAAAEVYRVAGSYAAAGTCAGGVEEALRNARGGGCVQGCRGIRGSRSVRCSGSTSRRCGRRLKRGSRNICGRCGGGGI